MKYKRYIINNIYRNYQVELRCTAKSKKEAAEKLGVSMGFINKYGMITYVNEPIDGVVGLIDSGYIIFDFDRKDLMRELMPWSELKSIIDYYYHEYTFRRNEILSSKNK